MAVHTESSIWRARFLYDIDITQVKSYIRLAWHPSLGACPSRVLPSRVLACSRVFLLYDIDITQVKSYIRLAWHPSLGACPSRVPVPLVPVPLVPP